MTIGFNYGVLNDSLEQQANEIGYTLGDYKDTAEKLRFSLNMVAIHSVLTDSETNRAFDRLHKMVLKKLKPLKKETED